MITHSEEQLLAIFSKEGLLGSALPDFEERLGQKEMAQQIFAAYAEEQIALIEAGTGIGKSLAYLVPAVHWALKYQERTVISTHTIALQEQLLLKDIPFLLKTLGVELKAVLIKGMGNYVCLRKLHEERSQGVLIESQESQELDAVARWCERTKEGTRSQIPFPIAPTTWEKVCAESDACNHVHCPHYKECFFFQARKEAADAQLLIVNHHLLLADVNAKRQEDYREEKAIIPSYMRVVLDEAHHLEQVALESLAANIDRINLNRLLAKLFSETHPERSRLFLIRKELTAISPELQHKLEIALPVQKKECGALVENAFSELTYFIEIELRENTRGGREWKKRILKEMTCHPYWNASFRPAFLRLAEHLKGLSQALRGLESDLETFKGTKFQEKMTSHSVELRALVTRLEQQAEIIVSFFSEESEKRRVRWIEISKDNVLLVDAQLDIAALLKSHLFDPLRALALCSATLTTNRDFTFMKERLGLLEQKEKTLTEKIYDSPFDYQERTLLVVPTDMLSPTDPQFQGQAVHAICRAIEASQGNAFVLFTSYEMLQQCYDKSIEQGLAERYVLLKQGRLSRHVLLEQFKQTQGSVLFATSSFWEGVDVPGEALRCVIIVKLPFQVPSEPLYQACSERIEQEGKNPFYDYAVPQAVIKFKQGFGRLMRKNSDRGCIVCLDNRLIKKGYGKVFLNSLPPCRTCFAPQERAWEEMRAFYLRTRV